MLGLKHGRKPRLNPLAPGRDFTGRIGSGLCFAADMNYVIMIPLRIHHAVHLSESASACCNTVCTAAS